MRKITFLTIAVALFSCESGNSENTSASITIDSSAVEVYSIEDTIVKTALDSNTTEIYELQDMAQMEKEMEKVYGVQWDFCDCVDKTDSIQKAIENANDLTDTEFDVLMNRFEEIDLHCKTLIAGPHATPAERKIHERKVKKCLKNR